MQAVARSRTARSQLQAGLRAVFLIQRCTRGMLVRRRLARMRAMQEAVAEFQRTMAVYAAR